MKFRFDQTLTKEDMRQLSLRHIYEHFGYVHYKMNKFEEYDLYAENKDFLAGDKIITFTDTNGRLLALKPDVTLSIVKNYIDVPGEVKKVYYSENIYRTSRNTRTYKEIMQTGLECIGDLDVYQTAEVLMLAAASLEALGESRYILDVSHMGLIRGFLQELELRPKHEEMFLSLLRKKNVHGIRTLFDSIGTGDELRETAIALASTYGSPESVIEVLRESSLNDTMDEALGELETICRIRQAQGADGVHLDFSLVNDMSYYNGVMFRGYIEGIPSGVLSGGRYDELLDKMGKRRSEKSGAIGFAINMDLINGCAEDQEEYDVDVLLLYGKAAESEDFDPEDLADRVNTLIEEGYSVQAQKNPPERLKYRKLMEYLPGGVLK